MSETKKMSKSKKILIAVIAIIVALLVAADLAIGGYLVNYAIGRGGDGGDRNVETVEEVVAVESDATTARIEANREAQAAQTAEFLKQVPAEKVEITADDGIRLSGVVYLHDAASASADSGKQGASQSASAKDAPGQEADEAAEDDLWAIVIHGYRGSHESATAQDMAQHYYDAGYDVLTPDLRASGESEGDYVGMGWLDRLDILDWIDWILAQNPNAKIVIHGVSMGAATTMMVSGEQTPDAVVAFVEDCGYTSVWDVFSSELALRFGLPDFPLLYTASALSDVMAGYSFEEASALDAVARSDKPMLFIHGTADDFILFDMMGRLYDAKVMGEKDELVSEGAGHADAMYELGDDYWQKVFGFINDQMGE